MKNKFWGIALALLISCGDENNNPKTTTDTTSAGTTSALRPENVPQERDSVKEEPVAEYRVKTENPLNDWYFQVRLYETTKTFHYLIRLQYEEIRGTDTLKLPNFGMMPKPAIEKGPDQYSCIIGFYDKDNKFREYKKVYVKENTLKIEALKHYGVR
jgi:hypothetical protein